MAPPADVTPEVRRDPDPAVFRDEANPTSNAIDRRIGSRPVRDDTPWTFVAADGTG